jgi:hypothetical protein
MRYVFLSIFLHFFSCLFLGTGSGFERISVPSRLGNSTTATPAGSPEKQPPASPQDQPMDIIYEDFDMPLASGIRTHAMEDQTNTAVPNMKQQSRYRHV